MIHHAAEFEMPLFAYTPSQSHSRTSVAAAESVQDIAPSQERLAMAQIEQAGGCGLTDEELHAVMVELGYVPEWTKDSSIRRARIGLANLGEVVDSGRTRPGKSGRPMTVWIKGGAK